jgi:poly-gamma-glutamate capsule biosynthesis protein CapA/YwtB (metallophosphatase superfamily)
MIDHMLRKPLRRSVVLLAALSGFGAWQGTALAGESSGAPRTLTITLTGDVGLNPTNQTVQPTGVQDGGFQTWADTTAAVAKVIDGDINFMNVETVVTNRNDLAPDLKGQSGPFNFRMHPNGLAHLVSKGFNVLSLANNHSMDYGAPGLTETLTHVAALRGKGVLAAGGIGFNREQASRPSVFEVKGIPVAFSAIGIVTNDLARHRAGPDKPGQIAYRFDDDYREVLDRLSQSKAPFKMLSIHYGQEGYVRADGRQLADSRGLAAAKYGIDLIIGHHAHVVRGVEMHGKSLIFYGLGNFLHHGTANITGKGICRDYGLMARVHVAEDADGSFAIKAVEAIPVSDTHRKAVPMTGERGNARVHVLNFLAELLDNGEDARGLRFTPQKNGTGLFCAAGAETIAGRIGKLCKGYAPAGPVPASLRPQIAASCSR